MSRSDHSVKLETFTNWEDSLFDVPSRGMYIYLKVENVKNVT